LSNKRSEENSQVNAGAGAMTWTKPFARKCHP